jgi:hypothetical protein
MEEIVEINVNRPAIMIELNVNRSTSIIEIDVHDKVTQVVHNVQI